jgi:hypothetical protein
MSGSITIWELGFASRYEPTQVESLSIPDNFNSSSALIHPTLSRLAFTVSGGVVVWDCRESQYILECGDLGYLEEMYFSLNGSLFAYEDVDGAVYLWKESPTGYDFYDMVSSNFDRYKNHISPDGRFIVLLSDLGVRVQSVMNSIIPPSSPPTQTPPPTRIHRVEFSPGEVFAAITQLLDNVVTVLHLKSGDPWLVIDTGVEVHGLRVSESVVVVVGEGKIISWDLPARNSVLNARASIDDSARITTFAQPPLGLFPRSSPISISPDLDRMAIMDQVISMDLFAPNLRLYEVSTGRCLAYLSIRMGRTPWLAPDGQKLWGVTNSGKAEGWSILEGSRSDVITLKRIGATSRLPEGSPWKPYGYKVTDDGWVLSSHGKRLIWLPGYLRSGRMSRVWSGRFLALLCPALPEPVLLELPVK